MMERRSEDMPFRRTLLTCVLLLPGPVLWVVLSSLREVKYPIVSAESYWHARLDGSPEFFRYDGYAWFKPPGMPMHGYWPLRVPAKNLVEAPLAEADTLVSKLIEAEKLHGYQADRLRRLTGQDFGTDIEAWKVWRDANAGTTDRDRVLAYLESFPPADRELCDYFEADARGASKRVLWETLFFWVLWFGLFLGLFKVRVSTKSSRLSWQRIGPAAKGLGLGAFLSALGFLPWAALGYGHGAFTTWQGPACMIYSGAYPWRGGVEHGATIGYRTFLEIMGTPPLWVLEKLPVPEMSLVAPLSLTGMILYGLVGFGMGLAVGFFKVRNRKHSFLRLR